MHRFTLLAVALAACSTPTEDPLLFPQDQSALPGVIDPGDGTWFVGGETTTIDTEGSLPGFDTCLYASLRNTGSPACPASLGGACLELFGNAVRIGRAAAGSDGTVSFDITPPSTLAAGTAYLQAVQCSNGQSDDVVIEVPILSRTGDDDNDGAPNYIEVRFGSDPTNEDTDGDSLLDPFEVLLHNTSPLDPDSDGGGTDDGTEVAIGTDPNDPTDDCTFTPDPSLAVGETADVAGVVAAINELREEVGSPRLEWDDALGAQAAAWAEEMGNNCALSIEGVPSVGELIFASGPVGFYEIDGIVDYWGCQRAFHAPDMVSEDCQTSASPPQVAPWPEGCDTLGINASCGQYNQIVWENTTHVGCGSFEAPACGSLTEYWACYFSPGGNFLGQTAYDVEFNVCYDQDHDGTLAGADADDQDASVQ